MRRRPLLRLALLALAVSVVAGAGSGAALCKYRFNCRVHAFFFGTDPGASDASLLQNMQAQARRRLSSHVRAGFSETVATGGYTLPTDFAFLPDDHVLVSEKAGVLRDADLRTGRSRIVLDLHRRVSNSMFRGLVTVAVDPAYARNRFVYVVYVLRPRAGPEAPTVARVSRFVLPPGGRARDEHVLVGRRTVSSCDRLPASADCLPSDVDHVGGEIAFAPDGTLFVSTGDGGGHDSEVELTAERAQNADALEGKILHITRDGLGVRRNPFWNVNPAANRSKVWALGLRNPFRLAVDPATGRPVAGDVGTRLWEEIDEPARGADLGWPCFEGRVRNPVYTRTVLCRGLEARGRSGLTWPLAVDPHYASDAIVGGAFLSASFPAGLRDDYVYGSWVRGWLKAVRLVDGSRAGKPVLLATRLPAPVAVHTGPDGALYVLCLSSGDLRRITPP